MPKNNINIESVTITPEEQFRIASLNMLHNDIRRSERMQMLIEELQTIDADVLCLQEVRTDGEIDILQTLSDALNMKFFHKGTDSEDVKSGNMSCNAILSKTQPESNKTIPLGVSGAQAVFLESVMVSLKFNESEIFIMNAHLAWGGHNGWARQHQLELLVRESERVKIKSPDAVIIIAGDLNEIDSAQPLKYMYGESEGHLVKGTYWVDAWKVHGTSENEITVELNNKLALNTAIGNPSSLFPTVVPPRRIDYILSCGWVYGRKGYPLNFSRFADIPNVNGYTTSDHYGIYTDILIPSDR